MTNTTLAPLTYAEIDYVHTCWKQLAHQAYPEFMEYLKIAAEDKARRGTVYN